MQRLLARTELREGSDCWHWVGSKTLGGYGQMRALGKRVYVHRISWELHVGPIPEGLVIDHHCQNPSCVNPWHMEPVTAAVNCGRSHGRLTHCQRGHEYAGDNIRWTKAGHRICRACDKHFNAIARQRAKEAA